MTSGVCSKNKEKKAKRKKKNVKKNRPIRGKKSTKKQKVAAREVEPGLPARARNSCTTVTHMTWKLILSYQDNFSLP